MKMPYKFTTKIAVSCLFFAIAAGCANTQNIKKKKQVGKVNVEYTNLLPSGNAEVTDFFDVKIVTPNYMLKKNTLGIAFAPIAMLAGAQVNISTSKDYAKGDDFKDNNNKNITNPFYMGSEFIDSIQRLTDEHINNSTELKKKFFVYDIYITKGMATLIYEEYSGAKSNEYRLNVTSHIFKDHENQKTIFDTIDLMKDAIKGKDTSSRVSLECKYRSDTHHPLESWKDNNGELLKIELKNAGEICTKKFTAQINKMLLK